jgi:hypothetical protein
VITERPWLTLEQLVEAPIQRCLIFEVDFEVPELTATERALRRWFKREEGHEKDV